VHKLGHYGYNTDQYEKTCEWYSQTFNLIPTDVLWAPGHEDVDVATFFRLDLGEEYVDHHCFLVARAETVDKPAETTVHHSSFEVEDLDTQMMGHQWLLDAGYELVWGIGRHVHGSQVRGVQIETCSTAKSSRRDRSSIIGMTLATSSSSITLMEMWSITSTRP